MKPYFFSAVFFTSIACITACNRTDKGEIPSLAGKGGNATLKVTPQHHNINIDSCMVYIKYNAVDAPSGAYDDSAKCLLVNNTPTATFIQLKKGNYYLYGAGYDPGLQAKVKGGTYFKIDQETALAIFIPVTEVH